MTIFENLVYNENSFTELFKNIMRFDEFRRVFLNMLNCDFSYEIIDFESFSTQKGTENGRPDLVISTPTLEIFVEIKVWNTTLTDNQPAGYLKELERVNKANRMLVLLIPKNYKYLNVYNERIKQVKSVVKTKTIYWQEIIGRIDQNNLIEGNSLFCEYRELLREWFEPRQIDIDNKFLEIMNSIGTPSSLKKLSDMINQIKIELQKREIEITKNKTNILNEYGFYCDHHGSFSLFVGEWFEYWKETGNSFCIGIKTDNEQLLTVFSRECEKQDFTKPVNFKETNWLTSAVEFKSEENIVENFAEKIKLIIDRLESTIG